MELKFVVCSSHLGIEFCGARQDVLIERLERGEGNRVLCRHKIVQVAKQKAQRVAKFAIVLTDPLHQVLACGHILAEVDACHPQADDLRA